VRGRRTLGSLAIAGLFSGTGCFAPPPEAHARLEQVRRQGQDFDAALDHIEERLLGSRANVGLWEEMAARHQQVSEVACKNVASHVEDMERHLLSQERKSRNLRQARNYGASPHISSN
jgi:hypothetical protein